MRVAGQVMMILPERCVSMSPVCGTTFRCIPCGVGAPIFVGASPELVIVFVILHGSGYVVTNITRPMVFLLVGIVKHAFRP